MLQIASHACPACLHAWHDQCSSPCRLARLGPAACCNAACGGLQGSGWGWLGYNKASGKLEVATLPNQDPLSVTVRAGVGADRFGQALRPWARAIYMHADGQNQPATRRKVAPP